MAGDWLKIEVSLPDKPEVWEMAGILSIDPDAVVGKLLKVWRWFDAHTESGNASGVTFALVDSKAGVNGFAEAMNFVGWLIQDGRELRLPNFDRHNGKTAKNRVLTAKRVAAHKSKTNDEGNDAIVSCALPREEKRREDKSIPSSSAAPSDRVAERLATVTDEAINAFNESSLPKSNGGNLPNVSAKVGREKRQGQVKRCLRVARQICEASTGEQKVTAEFWAAYFDLVAQDDFYAGRQRGGSGHENYIPDFELLTREATMLKIYDRMVEA